MDTSFKYNITINLLKMCRLLNPYHCILPLQSTTALYHWVLPMNCSTALRQRTLLLHSHEIQKMYIAIWVSKFWCLYKRPGGHRKTSWQITKENNKLYFFWSGLHWVICLFLAPWRGDETHKWKLWLKDSRSQEGGWVKIPRMVYLRE